MTNQEIAQEIYEKALAMKEEGKGPYDILNWARANYWLEISPTQVVHCVMHGPLTEEEIARALRLYVHSSTLKQHASTEYASIERGLDLGYTGIIYHWLNIAKQYAQMGDCAGVIKNIDFIYMMMKTQLIGMKEVPNAFLYAYMRSMRSMDGWMEDKASFSNKSVTQMMGKEQDRRDIHNAICHWAAEHPDGEWGDLLTAKVEQMWQEDHDARFLNEQERRSP